MTRAESNRLCNSDILLRIMLDAFTRTVEPQDAPVADIRRLASPLRDERDLVTQGEGLTTVLDRFTAVKDALLQELLVVPEGAATSLVHRSRRTSRRRRRLTW
ncbi:MAG: hypothetical protein FJW21_08290 [Acidimicrobiia bacterium]|nr:hypothetical protein [Acidimicrobiia bacterium]